MWLLNRLLRGRGSERPAAQTQQILTQVTPSVFITYNINILLMEIEQGIRRLKGNLHFNKKITLNHRKSLLHSSQSKIFLKKAFVSQRNNL